MNSAVELLIIRVCDGVCVLTHVHTFDYRTALSVLPGNKGPQSISPGEKIQNKWPNKQTSVLSFATQSSTHYFSAILSSIIKF
jgi:hypothetical protein